MPELPDISAYITALESRIVGEPVEHVRVASPFLLRTVEPPLASVEGRKVGELRRIGKRIAIGVEDDLWLVLHLMIAGPPSLARCGRHTRRPQSACGFRFSERLSRTH
jgi:formamidopyrimidine-DNA glycosylase